MIALFISKFRLNYKSEFSVLMSVVELFHIVFFSNSCAQDENTNNSF